MLSYTANNNITWKFITPLAPWTGGFYERLVGTIKLALKKSVGNLTLGRRELETVIIETEAVINSRPLVYVGEDFGSGLALTPADLTSLSTTTETPTLDIELGNRNYKDNTSLEKLLANWKKGQKHLDCSEV